MTIVDIPQLMPRTPSETRHYSLVQGPRVADRLNHREKTASKKVDDLSRHETKPYLAPKQDPRPNPREKTDTHPPKGGEALPGTVKT